MMINNLKKILTGLSSLSVICMTLVLSGGCAHDAYADLSNCVPLGDGKSYEQTPNTPPVQGGRTTPRLMLDEQTMNQIAKQADTKTADLAVVITVDRNGNIKTFVPKTGANKSAKLCDFKFPLKADTIKTINTIDVFSTTNPKTCWITRDGDEKCVVW